MFSFYHPSYPKPNEANAPTATPDAAGGLAGRAACADEAPISVAILSSRTYNALLRSRITTIRQLCALELHDLKWLRNFGKKAEQEVIAYRAHLGAPLEARYGQAQ